MKAKAYLSEVRGEYKNLRELRERFRAEKNESKRRELREILKQASSYYAGVLNEVWDTIEEMDEGIGREILIRRHVFLEPWEQITGELGCSLSTVYKHHSKAVARVQKILDGNNKGVRLCG